MVHGGGGLERARVPLAAAHNTAMATSLRSGRSPTLAGDSIESLMQIPPLATKSGLDASEVIHRHVPRTGFDPLQRAQVDADFLREFFLRQIRTQPKTVNVTSNDVVWFERVRHPVLHAVGPRH